MLCKIISKTVPVLNVISVLLAICYRADNDYLKGLNGHFELALYVDSFEEVDSTFKRVTESGATPVLEPTTEPWGQRTCYIADPEGNLLEIGSMNK